jgi:HTH-type transcriptional regulator/antitoxin HigA
MRPGRHYPIAAPDAIEAIEAIEAIKFCLKQSGLSIKDLEPMIGKSNRVYEMLGRKRKLTQPMIRRLTAGIVEKTGKPAAYVLRPAGLFRQPAP